MKSIHTGWGTLPHIRLLLLLTLLVSAGCGQTPSKPSAGEAPAQARLYARVETWYRAFGAKDANTVYAMAPPYVRAHTTLEAYTKDFGMGPLSEGHPLVRASVNKTCGCRTQVFMAPTPATRCVLLVDITDTDEAGKQTKFKSLAMWEYLDGEWYMGYPELEGESCPIMR